MLQKIKDWFAPPVFADPDKTRAAGFVNAFLIAAVFIILLLLITQTISGQMSLFAPDFNLFVARIIIFSGLFWANRRGYVKPAGAGLVVSAWLALTVQLWLTNGPLNPFFMAYMLIIMMAALFLGWRGGAVTAVISIAAGWAMIAAAQNGLRPPDTAAEPVSLAAAAAAVFTFAAIILTAITHSLTRALQQARAGEELLEARVAERTRDLQLAAEVGQVIARFQSLDELLTESAELIRSRFDLYYTQIYLIDDAREKLILRSGTGAYGRELLAQKHALPLDGKSINSAAVLRRQPVIVADTARDPLFHPNPALPLTRSEMAVPLIVGNQVIGVIDLQCSRANVLGKEALPAFDVLAGQLAIAIYNTRLLAEAWRLKHMVQQSPDGTAIANPDGIIEFVNPGWAKMHGYDSPDELVGQPLAIFHTAEQLEQQVKPFDALVRQNGINQGVVGHVRRDGVTFPTRMTVSLLRDEDNNLIGLVASAEDITEQLKAERQLAERVKQLDLLNDIGRQMEALPSLARFLQWAAERVPQAMPYPDDCVAAVSLDGVVYGAAEALELPRHIVEELRLSGQRAGNIYIAYKQNHEFRDAESAFVSDIGRRISSYIENQHLVEETQVRAAELQVVAEVGATIAAARNTDQLLNKVVELTIERFHMYHARIYLLDSAGNNLVLSASAGEAGRQMLTEQRAISLQKKQSPAARSARTRQSVIVNDAQNEPDFLPRALLPETAAEIAVPLLLGEDELLGVLDIQSDIAGYFNTGHINIFTTLALQTAVALQNIRQTEQTQEALQELRALQQVMTGEGWHAFMTNPERSVSGYVAVDQTRVQPVAGDTLIPDKENADGLYVAPMTVRGVPVGGLGVRSAAALSAEERTLLDSISQQVAEALERARLFEETELARTQTEALYAASDRIARAETYEAVLQALVDSTALQRMARVGIWLFEQPWQGDIPPETAALAAVWERAPGSNKAASAETRLLLTRFPDVVSRISDAHTYIVADVTLADELAEKTRNFIMRKLNLRSFAIFPLVVSGQWIGLLTGQASEALHIADMEIRQIENLTDQAATAIQNQRLLAESQERVRQEQILRRVSERVYSAVDAESVLQTAVQEVGRTLGLQAFIYLDDPRTKPAAGELRPANGRQAGNDD